MTTPEIIENQNPDEISCLLLSITGRMLLVPSVGVAEIVPFTSVSPIANSPDWLFGNYYWREKKIPLLSFEQLSGEKRPDLHNKCRVAVLNNTGIDEKLPFVAVMTQGIPRLARVTEAEIQQCESIESKQFELMHVTIGGEDAVIPDLAAIESAVLDLSL